MYTFWQGVKRQFCRGAPPDRGRRPRLKCRDKWSGSGSAVSKGLVNNWGIPTSPVRPSVHPSKEKEFALCLKNVTLRFADSWAGGDATMIR